MHRYNNQDHSMYTAMLTVENIFGSDHDIWDVNVDAEYHDESTEASGQPATTRDAPVLPKAATAPRRGAPASGPCPPSQGCGHWPWSPSSRSTPSPTTPAAPAPAFPRLPPPPGTASLP